MITTRRSTINLTKRFISNQSKKNKRFMQTIPITGSSATSVPFYSGLNYSSTNQQPSTTSKWAKHTLVTPVPQQQQTQQTQQTQQQVQQPTVAAPIRRSRTSRFSNTTLKEITTSKPKVAVPPPASNIIEISATPEVLAASSAIQAAPKVAPAVASTTTATTTAAAPKKRRVLRPRKALITLSSSAMEHLARERLVEYVDSAGKFDELVEQDDVKVLIDSKALFSIVGSEMDWLDDKLSSRFIFKNPNSKGTCGCGESFMV
ncbi:ISA1 [[Candida] subhashii]|uniref:ISA1 n=1 Tax=[Candida] subhashii TaxID=561895 RepID=A0A8J5QGM7_9ASCO|nr:ISA1 [[Candida] subhashii]KAG7664266.1 ISA1 [[Candida] subhashii]